VAGARSPTGPGAGVARTFIPGAVVSLPGVYPVTPAPLCKNSRPVAVPGGGTPTSEREPVTSTVDVVPSTADQTAACGCVPPSEPAAAPRQHVALFIELPGKVESVVGTSEFEPGPPMLTVTLGTVTLEVALADRGDAAVVMCDVLAARDLAAAFHTYAVALETYLEGFDAGRDHRPGQ